MGHRGPIAAALTASWFRGNGLPEPLGQLNNLGYIEVETILAGAPSAARLVSVFVRTGDTLGQGAALFSLDDAGAASVVEHAEAAIAVAEANRANLLTSKRPPEIEVIRAQMRKVANSGQVVAELAVLALMLAIVAAIAISRYRLTLD